MITLTEKLGVMSQNNLAGLELQKTVNLADLQDCNTFSYGPVFS